MGYAALARQSSSKATVARCVLKYRRDGSVYADENANILHAVIKPEIDRFRASDAQKDIIRKAIEEHEQQKRARRYSWLIYLRRLFHLRQTS